MSETKTLNVLLAPEGQLQGNGQLRESFHERRSRKGADYPMWFLNSLLVNKFKITEEEGFEAYSDGDILLHALSDALLGATGKKDLGYYFPSKKPTKKGRYI